MKYAKINEYDIANGVGVRVSLFVSGCRHMCKNCFNKEIWGFDKGAPYTPETQSQILSALNKPYIHGLSLLGGDPFEPENLPTVTELARIVKQTYPEKDIWCYTGCLYEQIKESEILEYIDVLVDGEYIDEKRNISLQFRGSDNQRIIDIKKTKQYKEIIEWIP